MIPESRLFSASLAAVFVALVAGCSPVTPRIHAHEMLNATLWQQTSAEYRAVARQAYHLASASLDRALADPGWAAALEQGDDYRELPPAIMLDLDETVLDNGRFEGRIVTQYGRYTHAVFDRWCEEASAPLVPGARAFLARAHRLGVTIYYYSARREKLRDCTAKNLRSAGIPFEERYLLLDNGRSKSDYRRQVARGHRIVLLIGDNLEDFVEGSKSAPAERRRVAEQFADRWGRQWIILPNAMYGHWESTLYDFDYRLPRAEQIRRKLLNINN